jgi:hypothetical protein
MAVLLYSILPRTASLHATTHPAPLQKKIEYSITPVMPSTDLRAMLEMRGNEGWDLVAPVVNNGTTTALIFKREKK